MESSLMAESQRRDPSLRRRRAIVASTVILLVTGAAAMIALSEQGGALRSVDVVKIGALIVLALLLGLRATTSFRLAKRDPALDDELTRANRASAARVGYWALMLAVTAAFIGGAVTDLTLTEVAPLVLAAGAVSAGLRFAILEARGDA
jgi:hypothetical protein